MTATGHAVIGVVIAAKIGNPALAIPIAFASHLLADRVPHWDPATNIKKKSKERLLLDSAMDVFLSYAVAYLITCLLYTSDAADDLTRVDLGGRRIIKKK